MRIRVALVVAAIAWAGCKGKGGGGGGGQSFKDGVAALCALPDHVPAPNQDSYEQRLAAVSTWAEQHVTNPDAKKLGGPIVSSVTEAHANVKAQLADAVKKTGIASCKLLDNDLAMQSFADAMKLVCDMPPGPDERAAFMKTHLLNPEVVTLIESLGVVNPADRGRVFGEAVTRAGLTSCKFAEQVQAYAAQMPAVSGPGLVELDFQAPTLVITPDAIVVDGTAIVPVRDGQIDPAELEGGALGLAIPRLKAYMTTLGEVLAKKNPSPERPPLLLVVAPTTPYRLLMSVIFSCGKASFRRFAFVVRTPDGNRAIPIALPEQGMAVDKAGLGMIISVTADHALVWSTSGDEGSLQQPKLDAPLAGVTAALQTALGEIVQRRWKAGKRTDADRRIVVMADSAVPMQTIAEVLAGVRAADGSELFPDVLLSAGME